MVDIDKLSAATEAIDTSANSEDTAADSPQGCDWESAMALLRKDFQMRRCSWTAPQRVRKMVQDGHPVHGSLQLQKIDLSGVWDYYTPSAADEAADDWEVVA